MLTGTAGCPSKEANLHDTEADKAQEINSNKVRVLLIGGSRLLQEGVIQLLDESKFAVQRCVSSVELAVRAVREEESAYDLLIVQLFGNSEVSFFEQLALLKSIAGERRVVLLAWPVKDLSFLASSFEAGVDAYLESSMSQEGFRQSLDLIISGEQIFPQRMSPVLKPGGAAVPQLSDVPRHAAANPGPGAHLSGREIEILRHLANGEPNKVIANELEITEATVKVHVKGILRKIGAANRTQAAIWAIHNGLNPIFSNGNAAH